MHNFLKVCVVILKNGVALTLTGDGFSVSIRHKSRIYGGFYVDMEPILLLSVMQIACRLDIM